MFNVELLKGIASLLWPVTVISILIIFRSRIDELLSSAKSRKVSVKIGGNEITLDDVTQQQSTVVADIQKQLIELKSRVNELSTTTSGAATSESIVATTYEPTPTKQRMLCPVNNILWVDDNPKNNSYFMEMLQQRRITVVQASSTAEGISLFNRQKFERIISDLGRTENGTYNSKAGLDLVKAVRELDKQVPIVIFANNTAAEIMREELLEAGASVIATGSTNLFEALELGCVATD